MKFRANVLVCYFAYYGERNTFGSQKQFCYFAGWYGNPVSSLPVKYFVCLSICFVICFFFVISSSSFLCFVLFVVFCLLFFRLVWKTSFLSSRRITVNLPALTHRYLPTLLSSKAPVKKTIIFFSSQTTLCLEFDGSSIDLSASLLFGFDFN